MLTSAKETANGEEEAVGAATVEGKWEYAAIDVKAEVGDAGLLAGMNDAGDLGWEVFLVKPEGGPYQSLQGKIQRWIMFCKRPKRLIQPANELEGMDRKRLS